MAFEGGSGCMVEFLDLEWPWYQQHLSSGHQCQQKHPALVVADAALAVVSLDHASQKLGLKHGSLAFTTVP